MKQAPGNAGDRGANVFEKPLRIAWRVFRLLAVAYVAVLALAYVFQRRLQYFPSASDVPLPAGKPYAGIEEFSVTARDGARLKGWYWPQASGTAPLLLIFHGNGGNRADRLEWMETLRELGCGTCIVDYRGYGGSSGSPTEEGLYRDAEAVYDWITQRTRAPLVYFGESLGTAVAVDLARKHPPAALILQSGFSSAADVGQAAYPFLPVRLLLSDRYDSLARLPGLAAPLLMIHGARDGIVPIRLARKLYEAAPEPKKWLEIPEAAHNDLPWVRPRDYRTALKTFIEKWVPGA